MSLRMLQVKPIMLHLAPSEIVSLTGIFETFTKTMQMIDVEIPPDVKKDMATILEKIVEEVSSQIVDDVLSRAGKN